LELLFQRQRHAAPIPPDEFQRWIEPLLHLAGGYAYSIVRNREDAEDAVQEAALKAFKAVGRFDRSKSFKGWLFAILRNCCLDLLRKRCSQATNSGVDPDELVSDNDNRQERMESCEELLWAMSSLTPLQREILELRYFGDCSYEEISTALGIPKGTVMSRLHQARLALASVYRGGKR
jgi:RNA polymerase sigma-70 factor, ECF subfamily